VENSVGKLAAPEMGRPMSAREREYGELPSPKFVLVQSQDWAGTFLFLDIFREQLPLTLIGKVDKMKLRSELAADT